MTDLEFEIQCFIAAHLSPVDDPRAISAEVSLTRTGVLDSLGVLELIAFLEARYGIEISDAETTLENLDTVRSVAGFVQAKLAAAGPPPPAAPRADPPVSGRATGT